MRITDRERDMLRVLAARAGETVPRQDLAAPGIDASERAVDVQINRLRRKIENDPDRPASICRRCAASAIGWWRRRDRRSIPAVAGIRSA